MRCGNISERASPHNVRAVGIGLERHIRTLAERLQLRRRHGIRCILLAAVVLDDNAAVEIGSVRRICLLRMVRMHRMGIVRRDQEAPREHPQVLAPRQSQCLTDSPKNILEEGRVRSLLRPASHLFVVKDCTDTDILLRYALRKRLRHGKGTLQVIQPRCEHKLPALTQQPSLFSGIEEQIMPHNVLFVYARNLCHTGHQAPLFPVTAIGKQRQHIHLRIIGNAVVHVPVHMDRHIRNDQQIFIHINQSGLDSLLPVHGDPSRYRERPVKPCRKDHSAVLFRVQPHIMLLDHALRRFLYLKGGRVAVRRRNVKTGQLLREAERDHRGLISCHEIALSPLKLPLVRFPQFRKARCRKHIPNILHRLKAGGTLIDKIQHLSCAFCIFLHFYLHFCAHSLRIFSICFLAASACQRSARTGFSRKS